MRSVTTLLASSVSFGPNTAAFSTSGSFGPIGTSSAGNAFSNSLFGSQGSKGGPTQIQYASGLSVQGHFGLNVATSAFPNPAGTFNLLGSNRTDKGTFCVIASSVVSTTGGVMLRDGNPWYKFVDFQFIPNTAMGTSGGFVSVDLTVKGVS